MQIPLFSVRKLITSKLHIGTLSMERERLQKYLQIPLLRLYLQRLLSVKMKIAITMNNKSPGGRYRVNEPHFNPFNLIRSLIWLTQKQNRYYYSMNRKPDSIRHGIKSNSKELPNSERKSSRSKRCHRRRPRSRRPVNGNRSRQSCLGLHRIEAQPWRVS